VCCSVLHCVAAVLQLRYCHLDVKWLHLCCTCVAVCCSYVALALLPPECETVALVFQYVAVCCSCVTVCCGVFYHLNVKRLQLCCSMLQLCCSCVAVVLQLCDCASVVSTT